MKASSYIFTLLLAFVIGLPGLFGQEAEVQQLKPIDDTKGEGFGLAVATNGDLAVVSTRMTRRLVVFERDQNYWMHTASLKGINEKVNSIASKGFGQVIEIGEGRIMVGVPESPIGAERNVGLVEVFTLFEGKWNIDAVLRAPIPIANSKFGQSISSNGNTILVGAPASDSKAGAAYIYTLEAGKWVATTLNAGPKPGAEFGSSVALIGEDIAVVGSPGKELRRSQIGALYVFQKTENNTWELTQTILGNSKTENLGGALAVTGNTLVAGAYDAAVIYNVEENKLSENEIITNPNAGETFSFASALRISPDGNNLLISASDHVFIYRYTSGNWALLTALTDDNPRYGAASAIGNDFFLINSPYAGENMMQGAVFMHLIPADVNEIMLR
jgi:hypothetical protein